MVDLADAPNDALPPIQVGDLGDGPGVEVVAGPDASSGEVTLILAVRGEHERAVVIEPTRIGVVVDTI